MTKSHTIRSLIRKCFLFNGLLFLGSLILFSVAVRPLMRALLHIEVEAAFASAYAHTPAAPTPSHTPALTHALTHVHEHTHTPHALTYTCIEEEEELVWSASVLTATVLRALDMALVAAYYMFWVLPVYVLSFMLNDAWYEDLASATYERSGKAVCESVASQTRRSKRSLIGQTADRIAGNIYRLLLTGAFILQSFLLLLLVPMLGPLLYFVTVCWLYSFYCFEYPWVIQGWSLPSRLHHFRRHWVYFFGFGAPFSLLCIFFPYLVSTGVFALVFPLFLMMAILGQPRRPPAHLFCVLPDEIDMFHYPEKLNSALLRLPLWYRHTFATSRSPAPSS
jgi:Sulfate transporter CysZ/Etoposide-induced protein 2.4